MSLPILFGSWLALVPAFSFAAQGDPARDGEFAVEIASPTANAVSCPTPSQAAEALRARMPNILRGGATRPGATLLILTLSQVGSGSVRLDLAEHDAAVVLERVLDAAPRGAEARAPSVADCVALADTVALIVERYLRQMGYRGQVPAPAPPVVSTGDAPPVPRLSLAAAPVVPVRSASTLPVRRAYFGVGVKVSAPVRGQGGDNPWTGYVDLCGDLHLGSLAVSASVGVGQSAETPSIPLTDGGSFRLLPMPVRLGVGFLVGLGRGILVPGVAAGVDVLWTSTSRLPGQHPRVALEPVVEAGAGYLLHLGRRAYLRVQAASVLNLQPHDFVLEGMMASPTIFRTARVYMRGGVDLGIAFGDRQERDR